MQMQWTGDVAYLDRFLTVQNLLLIGEKKRLKLQSLQNTAQKTTGKIRRLPEVKLGFRVPRQRR